jgi:hypothetical protein
MHIYMIRWVVTGKKSAPLHFLAWFQPLKPTTSSQEHRDEEAVITTSNNFLISGCGPAQIGS